MEPMTTGTRLPAYVPPTDEELRRRRAVAERLRLLREEMEPLGLSAVDLIREDRD